MSHSDHPYYKSWEGYEILMAHYDENLTRWKVPPESLTVDTRVGKTHVLIAGDRNKPALMYFHGWNGNASGNHGELDLPRLTEYFCVYCPDTPGHTGRSVQERPPTEGVAYAEWVRDVLDALDIKRVYVAGVSGGGYLVLKSAAHLGDRVSRAFGVVPHGIPPSRRPPLSFFWTALPGLILRNEWMIRRFVRKMSSPVHKGLPNEQEMARFMIVMNDHFKPTWNPAPLTDDELKQIQCPLEVWFGAHDITMKTDVAVERTRRLLPHAEVVVFEDEGHLFSSGGQRRVNDRMIEFFSEV